MHYQDTFLSTNQDIQDGDENTPQKSNKCFLFCIILSSLLCLMSFIYFIFNVVQSYPTTGLVKYDAISSMWSALFTSIICFFCILITLLMPASCCKTKFTRGLHYAFLYIILIIYVTISMITLVASLTELKPENLILLIILFIPKFTIIYLIISQRNQVKEEEETESREYAVLYEDYIEEKPQTTCKDHCDRTCWAFFSIIMIIFIPINLIFMIDSIYSAVEFNVYKNFGEKVWINSFANEKYLKYQNESFTLEQTSMWKMNIYCTGKLPSENSPVIVLSHGGGSTSLSWFGVQEYLSNFTRVCSYDRSGYGGSDMGLHPRNVGQSVAEIKLLFEKYGITQKIIWVGHSAGGVEGSWFAYKYPSIMSGLVQLDSPHEYYWYHENLALGNNPESEMLKSVLLVDIIRYLSAFGVTRLFINPQDYYPERLRPNVKASYNVKNWNSQFQDFSQFKESARIINESRWSAPNGQMFGNLPLYVVKASDKQFNKTCEERKLPRDSQECIINDKLRPVALWMIEDVMTRSKNSKLIVCEDCNHGFIWNKIEYTSNLIKSIYNEISKNKI